MGHGCNSDLVPYAKKYVIETTDTIIHDQKDHILAMLCMVEGWIECEFDWQDENQTYTAQANGWSYTGWKQIGKNKNIAGDVWQKNDKTVYLVNEAQNSNGGAFEMTVVVDSVDEIEEFCVDFSIKQSSNSIGGPDIIVHWWA